MGQFLSLNPSSSPISSYLSSVSSGRFDSVHFFSKSNALLRESSFCRDYDYTSEIPDECLALIFQSLRSGDRKSCSLVCRRWLIVDGQSRHRLSLYSTVDILPHIPVIFSRFDSVTKLSLRCDRKSVSINDEALALVSFRCRSLTRLKLQGCGEVTDLGMAFIAKNCKCLKKFSCGSCVFGAKGLNALLDHCSSLEELSVKRLRGVNNDIISEQIGPGVAASSMKSICLKELYNGLSFEPLIVASKKLTTLKLIRCFGDWDRLMLNVSERKENHLAELHVERLQVSDVGLTALSKCSELETLHLVKVLDCTDTGVVAVTESCKLLKKLHIDGWRSNSIGDESLIAIARNCVNLEEFVLIGVNPSSISISAVALHCKKLERLALCGSDTITDTEISYIAEKCVALRKLCIKGCYVTDQGIESFAWGCPNLVKIKVKRCMEVSCQVADWLRSRRPSLTVTLDVEEDVAIGAVEIISASDNGDPDDGAEIPPSASSVIPEPGTTAIPNGPLSYSASGTSDLNSRFAMFGVRSLVYTLGRWLIGNFSSNENCDVELEMQIV